MTECILWPGQTITTHGNTYGRIVGKAITLERLIVTKDIGSLTKILTYLHRGDEFVKRVDGIGYESKTYLHTIHRLW